MNKIKTTQDFDYLSSKILKSITIPKDGFLGLLAFGDEGLLAWRKARGLSLKNASQKQEDKKKLGNE
jgi:hypothetical protein